MAIPPDRNRVGPSRAFPHPGVMPRAIPMAVAWILLRLTTGPAQGFPAIEAGPAPDATDPDRMDVGGRGSSEFGFSVGSAGDVNGDGFDDVIVGAPRHTATLDEEAQAFVYLGSATGLSTTPSWIQSGGEAGGYFGTSVGTAADLNADGFDDVVVGAPDRDDTGDRAYVYHGSPGGLLSSPQWTGEIPGSLSRFGASVGTAGNVNGDTADDLLAGAPHFFGTIRSEGGAFVYLGPEAGRIPDGVGVPGTPLSIRREPGGDLTLSWDPTCHPADLDYEIHEGSLDDFASHVPVTCTTGAATTWTFTPAAGSACYPVVPATSTREGTYGVRGDGSERPQGLNACLPQAVAPSCL